eukprot:gene20580-biopygen6813
MNSHCIPVLEGFSGSEGPAGSAALLVSDGLDHLAMGPLSSGVKVGGKGDLDVFGVGSESLRMRRMPALAEHIVCPRSLRVLVYLLLGGDFGSHEALDVLKLHALPSGLLGSLPGGLGVGVDLLDNVLVVVGGGDGHEGEEDEGELHCDGSL